MRISKSVAERHGDCGGRGKRSARVSGEVDVVVAVASACGWLGHSFSANSDLASDATRSPLYAI